MFFHGLHSRFTRARSTSNMMFSAAAIAVVSEVNPDAPGASYSQAGKRILLASLLSLSLLAAGLSPALAQSSLQTKAAMNSALYNNGVIDVTPMLFHQIELGMSYDGIINIVGKSPFYCDSGDASCNAEEGQVSKKCLQAEFIQPNKSWMCHWDGKQSSATVSSRLELWFVGDSLTHIVAITPNGTTYRRDSGNTIHLEPR